MVGLLVGKSTGCTVTPDRDILANNLTLLPFIVGGEYLRNTDVRRSFFLRFRMM